MFCSSVQYPGVDPDIEEGGAYIEWVWCSHVAHTASAVFLCVDITQGVVGVSGGSAGKILNFDYVRVFLRPSKTTISTQNLWQLDCNLGDSSYGCSLEHLPLESAFVCKVLPPLSFGICRFECFMFAGHKAVNCIEMCAVSE